VDFLGHWILCWALAGGPSQQKKKRKTEKQKENIKTTTPKKRKQKNKKKSKKAKRKQTSKKKRKPEAVKEKEKKEKWSMVECTVGRRKNKCLVWKSALAAIYVVGANRHLGRVARRSAGR
jgi:hypothetical protein